MLTITTGSAVEIDDDGWQPDNVRLYVHRDKLYVGHDSHENFHVCDDVCATNFLEREGYVSEEGENPTERFVDADGPYAPYVDRDDVVMIHTADIGPFDPGNDPYILCAACETELYRDEEEFEAQYGYPLHNECDWPECAEQSARGFVFCDEHIGAEIERWLAIEDDDETRQWTHEDH